MAQKIVELAALLFILRPDPVWGTDAQGSCPAEGGSGCSQSDAIMEPWGKTTRDGREVHLITLTAPSGGRAQISTYGATLVALLAWDSRGEIGDVALGFDDLASYEVHQGNIGALVGRYANRIAGARFKLDGREYKLAANNGPNCLHGGLEGFDKRVWDVVEAKKDYVRLRLESPDMDEGFPGKLLIDVEYSVAGSGRDTVLSLRYRVETDKVTVVNPTSHGYFNLGGVGGNETKTVAGHLLQIAADEFLPTDDVAIPLAELSGVEGTPFDFRSASPRRPLGGDTGIGAGEQADPQMKLARGYDHSFVLRGGRGFGHAGAPLVGGTRPLGLGRDSGGWRRLREADVVVQDPETGRSMEMFTTEPAVQLYTGNFLGGDKLPGKHGAPPFGRQTAFCLEAQHFPDSPNRPDFPSVMLTPGQTWESQTVYWLTTV